ncbi:hypothetical protein [Neobacillus kokaensis]|uniref:Tyr recombinase domain-containing protein n=1 Tax=Neobacillus kokaensis TaxID=2759023 RepID=A0ABQ3N1K5_9BACI|nr:hypothetical protein [Neobacillus kokaensis]GHH98819.1 hypothetical protein AM1BK_23620 [Neobacillus kokaensis]
MPKNPAANLKEPKQGKRIPEFLTERVIDHLREARFTPMEKVLFEFMFSTGCRIGEIVSLDKNCIFEYGLAKGNGHFAAFSLLHRIV